MSILVKPGARRVKKSVRFASDVVAGVGDQPFQAPLPDELEVESGSLQEALIQKRDADKLCQDMHSTSQVDNARAKDLYLQVSLDSINRISASKFSLRERSQQT